MTDKIKALADTITSDRRFRYLAAGGVNTAFGYLATVALYYSMEAYLHFIGIMILANIICISFSFITYKIFVFRTKGNWLAEYLRCYVVYGGGALLSIGGLWFLVNAMNFPFWFAQGFVMMIVVAASYLGHSKFSFARRQVQPVKHTGVPGRLKP